jgi:hypothetical protein
VILKHISLYLDVDLYPRELLSEFGFRTRYVCNYLEREVLAKLRYKADGFNQIAVKATAEPRPGCRIARGGSAVPEVAFEESTYRGLNEDNHHEYFLGMLREGLRLCAAEHSIPLEELLAGVDAFATGGYENRWVHKKRHFKDAGLVTTLRCSLDWTAFRLRLSVERRGGDVLFDEQVLETRPDELVFAHQVKDVKLEGDRAVVVDKFGNASVEVALPL